MVLSVYLDLYIESTIKYGTRCSVNLRCFQQGEGTNIVQHCQTLLACPLNISLSRCNDPSLGNGGNNSGQIFIPTQRST